MTNSDLLEENGYEGTVIFENPNYEGCIIGISHDGKAIYSMDKMVNYLIKEDGMTEDEAIEFIEYNTIRACDYIADSPVIMYNLFYSEEENE